MMGALSLLSSLQSLDWTAQNAVLKQLLIKIEVADGFAARRIFGLLHRFFKLFRQNIFLFGFLEPRIRELILALPLLLPQDARRIGQVHIRPFARRLLVRKHHAQRRVDRQFRLAARAGNLQRLLALPHGAILILPAAKESSLFQKKRCGILHLIAKLKTKLEQLRTVSSLRRILPACKSRRGPQFRPYHLRIRARCRLRSGGRRSRLLRQRPAFHQQLHFVGVDYFAVQQRLRNALQRFFVVRQEILRFVVAAVDDALHFLVDLDCRVLGIVAMFLFSSSDKIMDLRSTPIRTLSLDISKSDIITNLRFCRAAHSAASFTRFARSAPENPGVPRAMMDKSTSSAIGTLRVCTRRISSRPFTSGRATTTRRSKRPGRSSAGSSTSGRFVAAIRITPSLDSKPSISTSNAFNVCSRSS